MNIKTSSLNKQFEDWFKGLNGIINNDKISQYNQRLDVNLQLKIGNTTFRKQFEGGAGNELDKDFWSKTSSSRLCFELYSWIVSKEGIVDFTFEKPLPGICSRGSRTKSYMDVFIETSNELWFIENKFTESPTTDKLSGAYYQTLDKEGNEINVDYSKYTFYKTTKNTLAANAKSLMERFSDKEQVIDPYTRFVKYALKLRREYASQWFDTKQEICHLLGIIMYMIDNKDKVKGRTINFYNIVFNKGVSEDYLATDDLANRFISSATDMVNTIIRAYNLDVTFNYEALSVQDVVKEYGDNISFCNNGKTMRKSVIENFEGIEKFL